MYFDSLDYIWLLIIAMLSLLDSGSVEWRVRFFFNRFPVLLLTSEFFIKRMGKFHHGTSRWSSKATLRRAAPPLCPCRSELRRFRYRWLLAAMFASLFDRLGFVFDFWYFCLILPICPSGQSKAAWNRNKFGKFININKET